MICPGCVSDHGQYATFTPGVKLSPDTHFVVGTIQDNKSQPGRAADKFDPDAELKANLEVELVKSGLQGQTDTSGVIVLLPTIAVYSPGNALVRMSTLDTADSATVLVVRCKLLRNGAQIGTVNVRRTVESFSIASGIASIGQWKIIFHTVAKDIVKELKTKIQSDR